MSNQWNRRAIGTCLTREFTGEWGGAPYSGGNATVLRSTDIDDEGHVDLGRGARRVIPTTKIAQKRLLDGDILLESSGGGPGKAVGRVAIFDAESSGTTYLTSNFFRTLRPDPHWVVPRFLGWKLQHFYNSPAIWLFQQQTTGIINLKHRDYLGTEIDLPPLSEQQKIAEVLDMVDEAIRKTEQIIAKLEQVKQGLLHDLLTRGIDDNGELRDPERHPEQFKDSPLGRIPKAWEATKLGQLAVLVTSGSRGWARFYAASGALFVRSQNVRMGYLDMTDQQRVEVRTEEGQRTRLASYDLLITITGNNVGNVAMVPEWWREPAFVSQHVGLARMNDCQFAPFVMHYLAKGSPGNQQIVDAQYGQSKPGLNLDNLREFDIPVPQGSEREAIIARLTCAQRRIEEETAHAEKLRLLKQALMSDLLTGKVRVTPLLETP